MTLRAIVIGLAGALLLAGCGYINNHVMRLEYIDSGHLIPVSVVGLLLLAMVTINPLLFRLHPRLAFRPPEAAVVVMMMLISLSIPGRGLMEQFTSTLAMPMHWNEMNPGWKRHRLLGYVPPSMFPARGRYDREVMEGFLKGRPAGQPFIGLHQVPWQKWAEPLAIWLPMLTLLATAVICLGLIVHRQWSAHERLRYPIAEFTASLIDREGNRAVGPIFRTRMFWIGLGAIAAIHVVNGLNVWLEGKSISIPMTFSFRAIGAKWPVFFRTPWGRELLQPTIYPIAVAFAFFLATDISFSVGISQFIYLPIAAILVTRGVEMSSEYMSGGPMAWHRCGAFLAFALIVIYIGRRYYAGVLKGALTFRRSPDVPSYAAWACRIMLLAVTGMTAMIIALGLDWPLAIMVVALVMLMFLGVSRIAAETGLFFIQPRWQPMGVLLGLFGTFALGPQAAIICGILCAVLCLDPSQAVMPYFINGLKLCDMQGVSQPRAGRLAVGTYVLALAVGTVAVLWANYNWGVTQYQWSYQRVPSMAFSPVETEIVKLNASDQLKPSERLGPLERLANIHPDDRFAWAAGSGFVLVLVFAAIRLRYAWWPLHPVMFMVWATYPVVALHHSFLLGWLAKVVLTRMGGHKAYHKYKPVMIGFIAGDLTGALIFMIAGAAYYVCTGVPPPLYRVFPR